MVQHTAGIHAFALRQQLLLLKQLPDLKELWVISAQELRSMAEGREVRRENVKTTWC